MKISHVRTFVVGGYRCNWIFVRIESDDGLAGVGEATLEFNEKAVMGALSEIGDALIGEDPFPSARHRMRLIRDDYWRTSVVFRSALSGVEGALYDLKGKALGVPVYDLLGGRMQDSVPVYANTWYPADDRPDVVAAKAARVVGSGFPALKFDPFGSAHLHLSTREREQAIDRVRVVREAIGEDADLLVEGHGRLDVHTAILIARALSPLRPLWFEEPVGPESIRALADVRRQSPVPIAAGERAYDRFRAEELLRGDAVDVLQPDICHVGGFDEFCAIANLTHAHMRPVAPHNVNGPVGNAMTLQAAASLPNVSILETCSVDAPWRHEITTEAVEIVDGRMRVPRTPGLGLELNVQALGKYPPKDFKPHHHSRAGGRSRSGDAIPWFTMRRQSVP